jgi:fatty-acyl-CoA synthase
MVSSAPSEDHGPTDVPLIETTIGVDLRATAARVPDRDALVDVAADVRFDYASFDAAVDRLATALIAAGIAPGDRVGMWAPNRWEWTLVQYATARAGVILVNVNPAYRSHELAFALQRSGTKVLFCAAEVKGTDFGAMAEGVRGDAPGLEEIVVLGSDRWESLIATPADRARLDEREAGLHPEDPINIQYTSGTTGSPKGATLTHRNVLNNGFFVGELVGYSEQDRVCIPVPFYHCFGMTMGNLACTSHGACMVIPAPLFDAAATLAAVEQERCTSLYGVPTMFIAELEDPTFADRDLSSLRTGIMAGSPCPEAVMRRVVSDMHMDEVSIAYGMTETAPVSTQTRVDDPLELRVGSVGRVGPHVSVRVADASTGKAVPRGETGELWTRGYSVMAGYWEDPEKTAGALDADGWMHTGDLATMDEQGYVRIVGRAKDMVIRGGENVSPREVEEFLYEHPDVVDVQVVGVPDERFGEELCACVRVRPGASLDADAVREYCRGRIAHFKIPRYVVAVDEFPMTVTGKIQKHLLRAEVAGTLGLAEAAG